MRSHAGSGSPLRSSLLVRDPTSSAQRPIARFAALERSISPSAFAWIFSYTRGTAGRIVGRVRMERLLDARDVGHERDRAAEPRGGVVDDAREAVREREEEQDGVGLVLEVVVHTERSRHEVLVRQHAALRRAGRPRRVDERRDVVLADRLRLVRAGAALELGEVVEADDLAERGQAVPDGVELLALRVVLDEREDGLRVAEDVRALARRVRRVEADDDGADRHDRPVEEDPLEARPGEDCDRVPAPDAVREQGALERVDPPGRLLPRDLPPALRLLLEVRRGGELPPDHIAPERRRRPRT